MLWIKAFHIIFVVTWFAGLFYLPRLFVYHAMTDSEGMRAQFRVMERKLMGITHLGAVLAATFGLIYLYKLSVLTGPAYWQQGWLHVKLLLVTLLIIYHYLCYREMKRLEISGSNPRSHKFYRWFNEFPALVLVVVIIMVVARPF